MKSDRYLGVRLSSTFLTGKCSIYIDPILKKKHICSSHVLFEHPVMFLYSFHMVFFRLYLY